MTLYHGVCVTYSRLHKKTGPRNGPILLVKGKDKAQDVGATPDLCLYVPHQQKRRLYREDTHCVLACFSEKTRRQNSPFL